MWGSWGEDGLIKAVAKQRRLGRVPRYLLFVHPQKRLHRRVRAGRKAERQVSSRGSVPPQPQLPRERCWGTLWEAGTEESPALLQELPGPPVPAGYLQPDLASGEGTGDPEQVQRFEGHQHEADVGGQVLGTLGVHEVVRGPTAHVALETHCGGLVHPGERLRKVAPPLAAPPFLAGDGVCSPAAEEQLPSRLALRVPGRAKGSLQPARERWQGWMWPPSPSQPPADP